jgi:hypothetical protein
MTSKTRASLRPDLRKYPRSVSDNKERESRAAQFAMLETPNADVLDEINAPLFAVFRRGTGTVERIAHEINDTFDRPAGGQKRAHAAERLHPDQVGFRLAISAEFIRGPGKLSETKRKGTARRCPYDICEAHDRKCTKENLIRETAEHPSSYWQQVWKLSAIPTSTRGLIACQNSQSLTFFPQPQACSRRLLG